MNAHESLFEPALYVGAVLPVLIALLREFLVSIRSTAPGQLRFLALFALSSLLGALFAVSVLQLLEAWLRLLKLIS